VIFKFEYFDRFFIVISQEILRKTIRKRAYLRNTQYATESALNHRAPSCTYLGRQTFEDSFSAVSKPIFASRLTKYAFFSIFRDLQIPHSSRGLNFQFFETFSKICQNVIENFIKMCQIDRHSHE